MSGDLEPISESVDAMFRRLGLSDPVVMAALSAEWGELAGTPWVGRSAPLFIQGTTLVVEAESASMIAFLRYGESKLVTALEARFGPGVVTSVEVRAPQR